MKSNKGGEVTSLKICSKDDKKMLGAATAKAELKEMNLLR